MPQRRGIGLRGRLVAFFLLITVVPLLVAVFAQQLQVEQQLRQRAASDLVGVQQTAVALLSAERARAADLADDLVTALVEDPLALALDQPEAAELAAAFLADRGEPAVPERGDRVAILDGDGTVLGAVGRPPAFAAAAAETTAEATDEAALAAAVRGDAALAGALLEVRELAALDGGPAPLGWLVVTIWTDDELLEGLGISGRAALVRDREVLGVTGAGADAVPLERSPTSGQIVTVERDGQEVLLTSAPLLADGAGGLELVVWTPRGNPGLVPTALLILVPAVVLAAALAYLLAGLVTEPVRRAAAVARSIAAGDLSRRLEPRGGAELEDLSTAMNTMSEELSGRLEELAERDRQLRDALARLGQTLSSSLDLNRILSVVVDTARETLGADRAVLVLLTPEGDALYTKVGRGLEGGGPLLRRGEGVLGAVVESGEALLLPGAGEPPEPAPAEPLGASQLAVPLSGRGRVLGALSLLSDDAARPFTAADLETLSSFATQASVAVENVLLHREARRLAITDPLTGLWNFRYLQLQADREVHRAERSGRPLSLIVADLDHFKDVNDQHGHQVGDEILIEVADRLRHATRIPDVVARYGGEEFIILLPDTDAEGARAAAERLRAGVASRPIEPLAVQGRPAIGPLRVTCSLGVATAAGGPTTVAALLRSADEAMYAAKGRGRDRVVVAGE